MTFQICFIGLGSNLGNSCEQLRQALADIALLPDTLLLAQSSMYRSAPLGFVDQPDFVNAVAQIKTRLSPQALLAALLHIEQHYGRVRTFQDAPRTLDLDLLLYGDLQLIDANLTIPHPHMHLRAFVLRPLLEISPGCDIPGVGGAERAMQFCLDQILEKMAE